MSSLAQTGAELQPKGQAKAPAKCANRHQLHCPVAHGIAADRVEDTSAFSWSGLRFYQCIEELLVYVEFPAIPLPHADHSLI